MPTKQNDPDNQLLVELKEFTINGVHYVERTPNDLMSEDFSSVDRLGADVRSIHFRCVT